jgi:hypothetical protein
MKRTLLVLSMVLVMGLIFYPMQGTAADEGHDYGLAPGYGY